MNKRAKMLVAAVAVSGLVAAGCSGGSDSSDTTPTAGSTDLASLVEAAKKEGTVVWLQAAPQAYAQQAAKAFQEEYGIEVEFLAVNSGPLQQRFLSEAQSGKISTDVVMLSNPEVLIETASEIKAIQRIKDAKLPALSDDYPTKYVSDYAATVIFSPYNIWYDKNKVTGDLVPKTLEDLTDPKYKGMINLTNPATSDSLMQFYDVIQQKYGDEWFEKVKANEPKFYPAASAAVQAVAGGEGALATPAVHSVGVPLVASGAPLAEVSPPVTTGSELKVIMTAADKAPHPNASKLFTNWLLSKKGNLATVKGDLAISPWEPDKMPSGWQGGRSMTPEIKAKLMDLLGL